MLQILREDLEFKCFRLSKSKVEYLEFKFSKRRFKDREVKLIGQEIL